METEQVYFKVGDSGYYVYDVDAGGYEIDTGNVDAAKLIRREIKDAAKGYTDVFVISHGYMTGRRVDGSIELVTRMVKSMEEMRLEGVKPLYIGLKWPSLVTTLNDEADPSNKARFDDIVMILREFLGNNDSSSTEAFPEGGNDSGSQAVQELVQEVTSYPPDDQDAESKAKESIMKNLVTVTSQIAQQGVAKHDESSIIDDGVKHSAEMAPIIEKRISEAAENEREGGLVVLTQDLIFGQFERRASNVGSRGVHVLLADLMRHAPPTVRFNLVGHSLGGHVCCSAAVGRAPGSLISRKVHSIVVAQGALDSKSLSKGGAYRPLTSKLLPVAGPIVETVFNGDFALKGYDVFHNKPAGRVGFLDTNPVPNMQLKLQDEEGIPRRKFNFKPRHVYNVESSNVIRSHSDIYDLEVANMIWNAAAVEVPAKDYVVTDMGSLPKNYWTDFEVRAEDDFRGCTIT